MATSWGHVDSDEEFAAEGDEKGFGLKTNQLLIVMIDSTPEMFEPWKENEDIPFRAALKCCQAIWRSKVVSGPKDLVSLLFVGTDQMKNSSNFDNLYHMQELSTVKVQMIEDLNTMKASDDFDGFKEKIGSSTEYNLRDAFWLAKIIGDEGKGKAGNFKIMYFTRNDNPHAGKPNLQNEAARKFKDFGKVELSVVAFNDEFQWNKFYSKLSDDESNLIKADNLESLMRIVRVKQRSKRALSKSTLQISNGIKLAVGIYSFVRPAKPPKWVNINKRTNEEVERTVNEFRSDTGMPVLKSEERKVTTIQGESAVFTKDELKHAKQTYEPGLTLVGFFNQADFNHFSWYRSPGYFIYPDEDRITGSKDLFVALLKRCHALKKIALVKLILSRGRSPKLACLVPSLDDPLFPQGFHVFPVPFCDEMRKYDMQFEKLPTPKLVSLMEKVIKKTTNKSFDILDVYNPMIQYRWRELERIALDMDEEEQDDFFDFTEPNEDLMSKRIAGLPDQINNESDSCASLYEGQKSTASVRKQVDMKMEVKHKRVEKLTAAVLKEFLESQKIFIKFPKKADLVAAVYKHFE